MHTHTHACTHKHSMRVNSSVCAHARTQVTRGITLPLEVYRDPHKGWSVRCAADIPVGAFVCAYIGELVLEDEVRRGIWGWHLG